MILGERLRIFTWHLHGNYLYYLTQTPHEFYLPVGSSEAGYAGAAPGFPWGPNVHEVSVDRVPELDFDCILFQSKKHYLEDQYFVLSEPQRRLPRIYLEHDPPQEHPTDTAHVVDDPDVLLVHVTPFNDLMWNSKRAWTRIIEHGVLVPPDVRYSGELAKGLVVVNGLRRRGRRLGLDIFERVRAEVPLDLIGMESEDAGGLGEISHDRLPAFMCRYRFIFNPIRYTSLGLAVCEAMSLGVPIIGLATTEMATTVVNDFSGYVGTDIRALIRHMHELLQDRDKAQRLGEGAGRVAHARFGISRFVRDWDRAFTDAVRRYRWRTAPEATAAIASTLYGEEWSGHE